MDVIFPEPTPTIFDRLIPERITGYQPTMQILVVVDGPIDVADGAGFGLTKAIEILRSTRVGCLHLRVTTAHRDNCDAPRNSHTGFCG